MNTHESKSDFWSCMGKSLASKGECSVAEIGLFRIDMRI